VALKVLYRKIFCFTSPRKIREFNEVPEMVNRFVGGKSDLPAARATEVLPQFSVVCFTSPFGLSIRLTNKLGAHKSEGKLGFFAQVYTNFTRVYHIGFYV